jgi:glutathione S-transferase
VSKFVNSVKSFKVEGMEPETIKEMEHRANVILDRLADALPENSRDSGDGPWLFGLQEPSALDAHAVVFIERMRDVGRIGLVPDKLNIYSQKATEQDNWENVMNGRRTMAPRPKA